MTQLKKRGEAPELFQKGIRKPGPVAEYAIDGNSTKQLLFIHGTKIDDPALAGSLY